MIKSISLQNFQSHKDSTLTFDPNVNIIIGNSDSGKTAIIRAIRKLAMNKPSGDEMKSHWGGKLQIEMFTDDAHIVYSKDKEAEYILGDTHFKAFGTEVPQEIKDALNFDSGTIQSQLDSPFLLSETAGAVASHFNKIAHLEVIDKATSNINSAIRELTSDIKYSEGQEKVLQESLEKFQFIETFETEVEKLERLEKQKSVLVDKRNKLDVNIGKLIDINEELEESSRILVIEKPLSVIFTLINSRDEKELELSKLSKLTIQLKNVQSKLSDQIAVLTIEKPINDLLGLYKDKEIVEEKHDKLYNVLSYLSNTQEKLNKVKHVYIRLKKEFEEKMGSVCILCGQTIHKSN